jgi:hypothetical protein
LLSTGLADDPSRDGARSYHAHFALGLAVVVSARKREETDELAKLYAAVFRAASQGLKVPILGKNPTFDPALMKTPAAKALKATTYISSSIAPWTLDKPTVKQVGQTWQSAYPGQDPRAAVQFGWAQAQVMYDSLNRACQDKGLSRAGLVKAAHEVSGIDTGGLIAQPLDYTKKGQPAERAVYLARPADVAGGLTPLPQIFDYPTAQSYNVSG